MKGKIKEQFLKKKEFRISTESEYSRSSYTFSRSSDISDANQEESEPEEEYSSSFSLGELSTTAVDNLKRYHKKKKIKYMKVKFLKRYLTGAPVHLEKKTTRIGKISTVRFRLKHSKERPVLQFTPAQKLSMKEQIMFGVQARIVPKSKKTNIYKS